MSSPEFQIKIPERVWKSAQPAAFQPISTQSSSKNSKINRISITNILSAYMDQCLTKLPEQKRDYFRDIISSSISSSKPYSERLQYKLSNHSYDPLPIFISSLNERDSYDPSLLRNSSTISCFSANMELTLGIMKYFNHLLPTRLLTSSERKSFKLPQQEGDSLPRYTDQYGVEHLCRLMVILPNYILENGKFLPFHLSVIQYYLSQFIHWLDNYIKSISR